MKKLLISIGLATITFAASAQNFASSSFLSVADIYMTNSVTFVTNLNSSVSIGTNITGVIATNLNGNTLATNNVFTVNMMKDIVLNSDRNAGNLTVAGTNACIELDVISAGAAATNAITLEFVAVPDGVHEDGTTSAWTCSTTAATSVAGTWRFGVPATQFIGCNKIRLRKVYAVAPTAAASSFVISGVSYNRFMP